MFLSIVIPVYNVEQYIGDCINSCLNQDIEKSDYEIILIDDCSPDNSAEVIKQYAENNSNIVYEKLPVNSGVSVARNRGIEISSGDYVVFLDADDLLKENILSKVKQNAENCDVLTVGRFRFFENNRITEEKILKTGTYVGFPIAGYITNHFIKKELIGGIRFVNGIKFGEDELFLFELLNKNPKNAFLDEPVYLYRIHKNAVTNMTKEKYAVQTESHIMSAKYLKEHGLDGKPNNEFYLSRINMALTNIASMSKSLRVKFANEMLEAGLIENLKPVKTARNNYIKQKLASKFAVIRKFSELKHKTIKE